MPLRQHNVPNTGPFDAMDSDLGFVFLIFEILPVWKDNGLARTALFGIQHLNAKKKETFPVFKSRIFGENEKT